MKKHAAKKGRTYCTTGCPERVLHSDVFHLISLTSQRDKCYYVQAALDCLKSWQKYRDTLCSVTVLDAPSRRQAAFYQIDPRLDEYYRSAQQMNFGFTPLERKWHFATGGRIFFSPNILLVGEERLMGRRFPYVLKPAAAF